MANHWGQFSEEEMYGNNVGRPHWHAGSEHPSENLFLQQLSSSGAGNHMFIGSEHFSENLLDLHTFASTLGNHMDVGSNHFIGDMSNRHIGDMSNRHISGTDFGNTTYVESEHFSENLINLQASGYSLGNQMHVESEYFPEEIGARFSQMWADVAAFQQNMLLEQSHQDFFANTTCWSTMSSTERRKEGLRAVVDTIVDQTKLLVEVIFLFSNFLKHVLIVNT